MIISECVDNGNCLTYNQNYSNQSVAENGVNSNIGADKIKKKRCVILKDTEYSDFKNGKGELMIIETNSEKETWDLGFSLGEKACAGQVYTLVGDLGVGKTIFTKGLAKGLGIDEPVSSPTFTIVQIYDEGRIPFYHFDVYRIGDVEEMDEIGYEDYIYGEGVSLIEWANLIEEILPEHYTEIKIEKDLEKGFDYRRITICEY